MPTMPHLPAELALLGVALILAIVQIFLPASMRQRQYGPEWALGARDETMPAPSPVAARLQRAHGNLMETLPLFAAAVLAATVAGRLGTLTLVGSHLYVWGRVLYVPIYAAGTRGIRTIVFLASTIGLLAVIAGLFVG
jgi:uncharacterized MAPEG superfamily protein